MGSGKPTSPANNFLHPELAVRVRKFFPESMSPSQTARNIAAGKIDLIIPDSFMLQRLKTDCWCFRYRLSMLSFFDHFLVFQHSSGELGSLRVPTTKRTVGLQSRSAAGRMSRDR